MQQPTHEDIQTVSSITGILPTDLQFYGGDYNNHYYRVTYKGIPVGAFWWQRSAKHWQGMNNANRLLRPNKQCDVVMVGIIDGMEAI